MYKTYIPIPYLKHFQTDQTLDLAIKNRKLKPQKMFFLLIALFICSEKAVIGRRLSEQDRVQQWKERGTNWPPTWQPESPSFRTAMELREAEIMTLTGADERWENFMQFTQSRMLPRFSKLGFKIIQTPPDVHEMLKLELSKGLLDIESLYNEKSYAGAYNTQSTKLVDVSRIKVAVQSAMRGVHETFAGVKLSPTFAYGIRINRGGSALAMHYDQVYKCSY